MSGGDRAVDEYRPPHGRFRTSRGIDPDARTQVIETTGLPDGYDPPPATLTPPDHPQTDHVAELAALLLDLLGDVDRETLRELARRGRPSPLAPGRLRDVGDLGGSAEICDRLDVKKSRVSMWIRRRADVGFPEPVLQLRCGDVYDLREVDRWWATWSATRRLGGGEP